MRQLPSALFVLLSMMAAAALVHRMVLNTSASHRPLAVLRSLGFTSRQFSAAGAAEGAAVSALVFVVAIPAGLLGAAAAWRGIAEYLIRSDEHRWTQRSGRADVGRAGQ